MHIAQTISAKDLRTRGQNLVDSQGRVVFFNGINLVYKGTRPADGNYQFYPDWEEDMYERLAAMGINVLRFGILWAAMEPKPGQYDMDYFAFVKGEMDKAYAYGISIILDMHQDLYAQRFSDGATLTGASKTTSTIFPPTTFFAAPAPCTFAGSLKKACGSRKTRHLPCAGRKMPPLKGRKAKSTCMVCPRPSRLTEKA